MISGYRMQVNLPWDGVGHGPSDWAKMGSQSIEMRKTSKSGVMQPWGRDFGVHCVVPFWGLCGFMIPRLWAVD